MAYALAFVVPACLRNVLYALTFGFTFRFDCIPTSILVSVRVMLSSAGGRQFLHATFPFVIF